MTVTSACVPAQVSPQGCQGTSQAALGELGDLPNPVPPAPPRKEGGLASMAWRVGQPSQADGPARDGVGIRHLERQATPAGL